MGEKQNESFQLSFNKVDLHWIRSKCLLGWKSRSSLSERYGADRFPGARHRRVVMRSLRQPAFGAPAESLG